MALKVEPVDAAREPVRDATHAAAALARKLISIRDRTGNIADECRHARRDFVKLVPYLTRPDGERPAYLDPSNATFVDEALVGIAITLEFLTSAIDGQLNLDAIAEGEPSEPSERQLA